MISHLFPASLQDRQPVFDGGCSVGVTLCEDVVAKSQAFLQLSFLLIHVTLEVLKTSRRLSVRHKMAE